MNKAAMEARRVALKPRALSMLADGIGATAVSRELDIPTSTIWEWRRQSYREAHQGRLGPIGRLCAKPAWAISRCSNCGLILPCGPEGITCRVALASDAMTSLRS